MNPRAKHFFALIFFFVIPALAQNQLVKISVDRFTNTDSVHRSEVEPDTFSWGSTIVSALSLISRVIALSAFTCA